MPPVLTVPRELKFTYNALAMGGTSAEYQLDAQFSQSRAYEAGSFEFVVIVLGSTVGELAASTTALEDALRIPDKAFSAVIDSETIVDWDPTATSPVKALRTSATATKIEDPRNTARSQVYRVAIAATLPADRAGDDGLQDRSVDVLELPTGQRVVTISGTYTALGANSARAQFDAEIDGLSTAVLADFGGDDKYDKGSTTSSQDKENKAVAFTRVHRELVFNQPGGTAGTPLNSDTISNHTLVISRTTTKDAHSIKGTEEAIELVAAWDCDVVISETTNLRVLYEGLILPFIINEATRQTSASSIALLADSPNYDKNNRISANVRLLAYTGAKFVTSLLTTTDEEQRGIEFIPVYSDQPHDKWTVPVPAFLTRTTVTRVVAFGGQSPIALPGGGGGAAGGGGAGGNNIPRVSGNGDLQDLTGLSTGIFKIGFSAPGEPLVEIKPPVEGGGTRGESSGGGRRGGGGVAGGRAPGDIPGLGQIGNGVFVPTARNVSIRPLFIGIPPYEVELVEATEETVAVYVTTPRATSGSGSVARGGGDGDSIGGSVIGGQSQ